jgi:hypothetical protein
MSRGRTAWARVAVAVATVATILYTVGAPHNIGGG